MTQAEIMVKLALDSRPLKQGLDEAKKDLDKLQPNETQVKQTGVNVGQWFGTQLARTLTGLFRGLIIVQLINLLKEKLIEFFDWASKQFAAALFPQIDQSILDANKAIADRFRKMRQDREKAEKDLAELQKEYREAHMTDVQKIQEAWKKVLEHTREVNRAQSDIKKHVKEHENIVKLSKERLALAQALNVLENLTTEKRKRDEAEAKKQAEIVKKRHEEGRGLAAPFTGPLDEINAKIIEDAKLLRAYDNPITRGNLNQDLLKRRQIVDNLSRQVAGKGKELTPAEVMTQKILDMLIDRGAIKVNVVNAE